MCTACRVNIGRERTVKAVVYKGPNDVSVEEIPDAKIEHPAT